jgi:hypothetical protein
MVWFAKPAPAVVSDGAQHIGRDHAITGLSAGEHNDAEQTQLAG